jgi:Cys-tRNA(Pro)/Cys-tRNA(Cys) deacylase
VAAKTNAARLLDRLGIRHEIHSYRPDAEDLSAERLARELSMPPERIFKTIVLRGDRTGPLFAVLPVAGKLDLKALARLAGDKGVEVVPLKEVQPLTGYVRGAVTALASRKELPVFLDESALLHDAIGVSAGVLGGELVLAPADYLRATRGVAGPIAG